MAGCLENMDKNIITLFDETDRKFPKAVLLPVEEITCLFKTEEEENGKKIYLLSMSCCPKEDKTKKLLREYRICYYDKARAEDAYRQIREILNPVRIKVSRLDFLPGDTF
jgi:hypothetical protein